MTQKIWFVGSVLWLFSLAAYGAEALVTGYHLKPASAVVKVGGTVKLKLVYCFVKEKSSVKPKGKSDSKPKKKYYGEGVADDELAPLVAPPGAKFADDELAPLVLPPLVCEGDDGYGEELAPLMSAADVKWKVDDGQGRVSGDLKGATYHAPASKPTPNKATVSATVTYNAGKSKTILLSRITILDEVKTYTGTFTMYDVTVNSEYTTNLTGNIRWEFDEYYDIGGWREYTGNGTATLNISRIGCGTAANFSDVPVEGRLKVYDDKRYDFLINLVGDAEQTRTCRRPDLDKHLKWEETYSSGGHAMNQGDPCGLKEFYPRYGDATDLSLDRKGGCADNIRNQYREGWSFKAVK